MSTSARTRAKPGDIVEVETPAGLAYLNYVGKHPEFGDAIVVSPTLHPQRPATFDGAFTDGYLAFYPLSAAVSQNMVQVVGRRPVPAGMPPTHLRLPGVRSERGVETWVIEGGSGERTVKTILSDEERRLPIGAIWNHAALLHYLATGWRPEQEA